MPPLPNIRQEKFVQGLFEGKSATRAYADAGYRPHQGNSSRLRWFEMVQNRLAELQAEAAKSSAITVQSICTELDEAVALAKEKGQAAPMVSASALKAKLAGLMVDRQTVAVSVTQRYDREAQANDIIGRIAAEHGIEDAKVVARCFGLDPAANGKLIEHRADEWKRPRRDKRGTTNKPDGDDNKRSRMTDFTSTKEHI